MAQCKARALAPLPEVAVHTLNLCRFRLGACQNAVDIYFYLKFQTFGELEGALQGNGIITRVNPLPLLFPYGSPVTIPTPQRYFANNISVYILKSGH